MSTRSSTSAHTPGPWRYEIEMDGLYLEGADDSPVLLANSDAYGSTWIECEEADARLIAAAPDLLTALQVLLNATMYKNHPAESEMARAAIAKATQP